MKKIMTLKMFFCKNHLFFSLLTTLLIIGAFPLFLFDKVSFFILLKQWHHPIADCIAPYLTWVGDGVTYLCILLILALSCVSCRKIIIIGGSFVCMSVVVQLLKRVFFVNMLRPMALLPRTSFHLIDGVPLLMDLSFPSGHSATVFVLVSVIQLLSKNKIYGVLLLGVALIVAYSRIYLCQHFYIDVYIGILIGTISAVVVYMYTTHLKGPNWLDSSIYCLFIYVWKRLTD